MTESLPLADLGAQPQGGQCVDPVQTTQPRHGVRARSAQRELRELCLDLIAAGDQHVVACR